MELVVELVHARAGSAQRSLTRLPRLYKKYAGHDNNRDFYMSNLRPRPAT